MKIIHRSPDALVVRDSGFVLRGIGLLLCALSGMGALVIRSDTLDEATLPRVPATIALLLGVGGVLLVVLPGVTTFALDLRRRVMIVSRRALLRPRTCSEMSLRDVAAVEVESSRDDEGALSYRVVTRLKSGARVPWTSYSTGVGLESMRQVARAATEMLDSRDETAPLPSEPETRSWKRMPTFIQLFSLPFLAAGLLMLWTEQRSLSRFQPTSAVVTEARVELHHDSDGSSYRPVVTYQYAVDGLRYESGRVTPLGEDDHRGRRWATAVAGRFQPGQRYVAYYDPDRPDRAFLVRTRSAIPWVFTLLPLAALMLIARARRRERAAHG